MRRERRGLRDVRHAPRCDRPQRRLGPVDLRLRHPGQRGPAHRGRRDGLRADEQGHHGQPRLAGVGHRRREGHRRLDGPVRLSMGELLGADGRRRERLRERRPIWWALRLRRGRRLSALLRQQFPPVRLVVARLLPGCPLHVRARVVHREQSDHRRGDLEQLDPRQLALFVFDGRGGGARRTTRLPGGAAAARRARPRHPGLRLDHQRRVHGHASRRQRHRLRHQRRHPRRQRCLHRQAALHLRRRQPALLSARRRRGRRLREQRDQDVRRQRRDGKGAVDHQRRRLALRRVRNADGRERQRHPPRLRPQPGAGFSTPARRRPARPHPTPDPSARPSPSTRSRRDADPPRSRRAPTATSGSRRAATASAR